MSNLQQLKEALQKAAVNSLSNPARFFKTAPGQYAAHDQFNGVSVPVLRTIAKRFRDLTFEDVQALIESKVNEERLLALLIVVLQYQKGTPQHQEVCYQWYLRNRQHVNNWNLVDASAPYILGAYVRDKNREILTQLAHSETMWERRIAIVATWYLIRKNDLTLTFTLSEVLLQDEHDLMHKAVGWMLREAGKKDQKALILFLEKFAPIMPRTMLRYALEKFTAEERQKYLLMGK